MDHENSSKRFENVFSNKVKAGKRRTYFFDVRRTKGEDYFITLTESTKRYNDDGYVRHKIFLYKEDFNRFLEALTEVVEYVKKDLMPHYDYDEFTRKQQEWDHRRADGDLDDHNTDDNRSDQQPDDDARRRHDNDDMSW